MTLQKLLLGSALHLVSNPDDAGSRPRITAWDRVAASGFDGDDDGRMTLSGAVTTTTLGVDGVLRRWLTGVAMAYSVSDGTFGRPQAGFQAAVTCVLGAEGALYAIKVPIWRWLGLRERIARRRTWERVDATVACFDQWLWMEVTGRTLWHFMCERGTHEKVYGELKGGFAFDCPPTEGSHEGRAWQVFSIIAFNLMRAMQIGATERRSTNYKRRTSRPFQTIQTSRYGFINRAGLLVQPGGRQVLDVDNNPMVHERFKTIESALAV